MYAVIRIRGHPGTRKKIENILKLLRLNRVNSCVILPENPSYQGMIKKVYDFVAYGKINRETLIELLKKRLRLKNGRRVDEALLKNITGFDTFENFADALLNGNISLKNYEQLQPFFRLTPPSGGHKSIKQHYPKGSLGNWGENINELIKRMI